jgi:hypothetical protein
MTVSDGMRPEEADINAIENIGIAETKDHGSAEQRFADPIF